MTQAEASEFVSNLRRTFSELAALPMPSIAVLEGGAFGGGAELALACDLRIADTNAVLAFPETRLGIIPGAGGTQRLPRLVGLGVAKVSHAWLHGLRAALASRSYTVAAVENRSTRGRLVHCSRSSSLCTDVDLLTMQSSCMWTSHKVQAQGYTTGSVLQELIFTARRVGGSEARQLGLVDHCVDAGGAMDRALELARDISQVSWLAICVEA
jgi:enoyl-CoA hydratase/carnithine racemase